MMHHGKWLSALLALSAGCADVEPTGTSGRHDGVEVREDAIKNGSTLSNDQYTVGLRLHYQLSGGFEGTQNCTAIILTPRWLMTSAHCLHPAIVGENNYADSVEIFGHAGTVVLTTDLDSAFTPSTYIPFNTSDAQAGNDIGIIELTTPLPSNVATARVFTDTKSPGTQFQVAGYGPGNIGEVGCNSLSDLQPRGGRLSVTSNTDSLVVVASQNLGPELCRGDSGGPWYNIFGTQQLAVALSSRGRPSNGLDCNSQCFRSGDAMFGTRLRPWVDWAVNVSRTYGFRGFTCLGYTTNVNGTIWAYRRCTDG